MPEEGELDVRSEEELPLLTSATAGTAGAASGGAAASGTGASRDERLVDGTSTGEALRAAPGSGRIAGVELFNDADGAGADAEFTFGEEMCKSLSDPVNAKCLLSLPV
mmetsp:Transcript_32576/g.81083  ORF Transcript_32576/g.81083 Transcript_32576/m.81083 type:complete len:108 (-) Transcript_32576:290-613(-)